MNMQLTNRVILKDGVSFVNWRADLQAELSRNDVLGHVFHDIRGIDPELEPTSPEHIIFENDELQLDALRRYKTDLRAWIRGEFEAQNIIIQRLDDSKKPHNYHRYTAKQLYDMLAGSNEIANLLPHSEAFEKFISTKLTTTAEDYCTQFLQNLQNVNNAADSLSSNSETADKFKFSEEVASIFFVKGTKHVRWLDIWRETKALNASQYAPLYEMISTLRASAGTRNLAADLQPPSSPDESFIINTAAAATNFRGSPNSWCRICKHKHRNKNCFIQHPEKAPPGWNTRRYEREDDGSKSQNSRGVVSFVRPLTTSTLDSDNDDNIIIA